MLLPRIPLPLLPLCIKAVQRVSGALLVAHDALERLHGDLCELHDGPPDWSSYSRERGNTACSYGYSTCFCADCQREQRTPFHRDGSQPCDNCGQPTKHIGSLCYGCTQDAERAAAFIRPAVCVDCGTSDDAGMCDSCAVLNTGRVPS